MRVAVIVGSTREGRRASAIAAWLAEQARARGGLELDLVDLAETGLPLDLRGEPVEALRPRIAAADAFLVVTPEYNHSYPAGLKIAIDAFRAEWQAKPVGFVAYGGVSGGLRAVEHLRQVFAELHAVTIRDTVSFHNVWTHFGASGEFPVEPEGAAAAAKTMLDQLAWWGVSLREAREKRPYAA